MLSVLVVIDADARGDSRLDFYIILGPLSNLFLVIQESLDF